MAGEIKIILIKKVHLMVDFFIYCCIIKIMKQKGFTITELLIVIFIIGLLSSGLLINYRSINKKYSLDQGIQLMLSDLRRAQHMSMNGVGIDETTEYCGYGLVINSNSTSYIFYADKSNNCDTSNNKYAVGDVIIGTIVLPKGIRISSIQPASDILFKYPEPIAYINQNFVPGASRIITLQIDGDTKTASITVNSVGLIQGN